MTPCRLGGPKCFKAMDKIKSGPQVGRLATSPLPSGASPMLRSGGQNQTCPTCGRIGYITPAVWGVPNASEPGTKPEGALMCADPCHLGGHQRFRAGDEIRSGAHVGGFTASPLPSGGSPMLECGGQNQKWRHLGGFTTSPLPSWESPTLQSGVQNQQGPRCGRIGYIIPPMWGVPNVLERGTKLEVARNWADWLHHPCRGGGHQRFEAGHKMGNGPQVTGLATSRLTTRGSPTL